MNPASDFEEHPVRALWRRHHSVAPYPRGVLAVPEAMPGRAFFPGGYGLWVTDKTSPLPPWPLGGIMVLGHDFHSEHGYRASLANGEEPLSQPTWRTLVVLAERVQLPLARCFFTNVFMGLREGHATTGTFPGASDATFVARCQTFLRDQLNTQRPALILTLGIHAPRVLAPLAKSLMDWCDVRGFRQLDERGALRFGVTFEEIELRCTVAALVHPSLRGPNLRHRRYGTLVGAEAEVAMLSEALRGGR